MSNRFDYRAHGLQPPPHRRPIPGDGPQTAAAVLDRMVATQPDREALVGRSGRYSFGELDREVNRAANALSQLGVEPGDPVAACLPNDVDIVVAFLGAMRLGALWVGINRPLAAAEKLYLLRDSGARVLLAEPGVADEVEAACSGHPIGSLELVVRVERGAASCAWRRQRVAASDARPAVVVDPYDPAAIAYTSGTTGHPKGAVHSHHNLMLVGSVSARTGAHSPDIRMGSVLPLTILNLIVLVPLVAFQVGSCCVCMDRIDPEGIAEWVRDERVGHFAGVPTIFHDLLTHPGVKPSDLASLVRPQVGGAECPEEFRALYRERLGKEVGIGYGMTEAPTAVAAADGSGEAKPGLCGRALPQVEIHILGEDGQRLSAGEVGEICVAAATRGEWAGVYTPMLGYWNRAEATEAALDGGVYHTGDLGLLDEEGDLFIRGRRNELILRGGANVYPAEVERVLQSHPDVAGCAVLGLPHPRLGERVVAVVQSVPGVAPDPTRLVSHIGEQLARYKVPDEIAFIDSLPRNAMGKVVKRALTSLFDAPA